MKKEDVVRKLTSRKFWVAVAEMVASFMLIATADESTIQLVCGAIMSVGGAVAYVFGEGFTDIARAKGEV